MSHAAKSLFYFAWYMIAAGIVLLFAPDLPLRLMRLPVEGTMWIRIIGMLVLVFSYYYVRLARAEVTAFFRWTVHTRGLVPVFFAAFILLGMPPILFLFALGDFAGALWTAWALKKDRESVF